MLGLDTTNRQRLQWPSALAWLALALVTAVLCTRGFAAAANDAATAVGPALGELPSYAQLFGYSPIINGIIVALSILVLLLFLYFVLTINTANMVPPSFIDDVTKLVIRQQHEEAAKLCRTHRHIFSASIIQRCVENAAKQHSVIMEMLDTEGRRRADIVWNRISYLADVSNVAPMLGLLGTVRGMIKAFFSLQGQTGSINSMALSASIGEAMATTLFGLAVAIMALFFYSLIKARVTRALADVEQVVHSIADHIKRDDGGGDA